MWLSYPIPQSTSHRAPLMTSHLLGRESTIVPCPLSFYVLVIFQIVFHVFPWSQSGLWFFYLCLLVARITIDVYHQIWLIDCHEFLSSHLPGQASNWDPPDFCFLRTQNHICEILSLSNTVKQNWRSIWFCKSLGVICAEEVILHKYKDMIYPARMFISRSTWVSCKTFEN
jgi:hypothetical protein